MAVATELMRTTEYERVQIKDVADRAGVALGTLYRYFASKDHLFAEALDTWAAGFGARSRAGDGEGGDACARVQVVYRRAARAFERAPRVFEVLVHLTTTRDEHAAAAFARFTARQQATFELALADLPAPDRQDVQHVMSAVLAEALRGRQGGQVSMAEVYRRIDRAAVLILG